MQGVVQGPEIRVDLFSERSWQKAEVLPRFHRGTCQHNAPHLAREQCAHGLGHCQVCLTGAGRADPEDHNRAFNGLDVAALPWGLRVNGVAVSSDDVIGSVLAGARLRSGQQPDGVFNAGHIKHRAGCREVNQFTYQLSGDVNGS